MKSNDFSDARVLVTGGAGFIGSALVWALNRRGCERIVVCDRLVTDEKWRNLTPLRFADYVEADDLLPRLQNGALGKFDLILHLGACASTTEHDAGFLIRNNYEFTRLVAVIVRNRVVLAQLFQHRVGDHLLVDHLAQFELVEREDADHLHQARRQDLLLRHLEIQADSGLRSAHQTASRKLSPR